MTLELENRQQAVGIDLRLLRSKKRLKCGGTKTLSTFPILEEAAITALMESASAYRSTGPSAEAGPKGAYGDARSIGSRYDSQSTVDESKLLPGQVHSARGAALGDS